MVLVDDNDDEDNLPVNEIAQKDIRIPCFQCNLVFSMAEFPAHQAAHQQGKQEEKINTDIKCTECSMPFDTIENLISHMKAVHFSMWGAWSQFYNWNQMDQYGFPYMQALAAPQVTDTVLYAGSPYDTQSIPGSSHGRWAARHHGHDHGHHFGGRHGHGHGHDHGHGDGHGHGHRRRFHFLHHRRHQSRSHSRHRSPSPKYRRERLYRRSPERFREEFRSHSPPRSLTLAEQALREEYLHSVRRSSSRHRFRDSSPYGRRRSRSFSPDILRLEDANDDNNANRYRHSTRSPSLSNEPDHSHFSEPIDEWFVADSWRS